MEEIQIITEEEACVESMSEEDQRAFYIAILTQIIELHRQKQEQEREGMN